MTTRKQKRNEVAELVSGEIENSVTENNQPKNLIAGPSESPRVHPENLEEIKSSLKKEVMAVLAKILAENQKKTMKHVVPIAKQSSVHQNAKNFDSETENISVVQTSTVRCKNKYSNFQNNSEE